MKSGGRRTASMRSVAILLVLGVAGCGGGDADRADARATPESPTAERDWLASLPAGAPPKELLAIDNEVFDVSTGTPRSVAFFGFYSITGQTYGDHVVLQGLGVNLDTSAPSKPTMAWARRTATGLDVRTVSGGPGPLAVNADATRAAYAVHGTNGNDNPADDRNSVAVVALPGHKPVAYADVKPGNLRADGFLGDRVSFSSTDPANFVALLWDGRSAPAPLDEAWTKVMATEPRNAVAVINDNRACGHLVRVSDAVPAPPGMASCLESPAFTGDGALVGAYERKAGDVDATHLRVRRSTTGEVVSEMALPVPMRGRPSITVIGEDEVLLVMADPQAAQPKVRHTLVRCRPRQGTCEAAWRSDADRDPGAVSVIRP